MCRWNHGWRLLCVISVSATMWFCELDTSTKPVDALPSGTYKWSSVKGNWYTLRSDSIRLLDSGSMARDSLVCGAFGLCNQQGHFFYVDSLKAGADGADLIYQEYFYRDDLMMIHFPVCLRGKIDGCTFVADSIRDQGQVPWSFKPIPDSLASKFAYSSKEDGRLDLSFHVVETHVVEEYGPIKQFTIRQFLPGSMPVASVAAFARRHALASGYFDSKNYEHCCIDINHTVSSMIAIGP